MTEPIVFNQYAGALDDLDGITCGVALVDSSYIPQPTDTVLGSITGEVTGVGTRATFAADWDPATLRLNIADADQWPAIDADGLSIAGAVTYKNSDKTLISFIPYTEQLGVDGWLFQPLNGFARATPTALVLARLSAVETAIATLTIGIPTVVAGGDAADQDVQIQDRSDMASVWTSENPVLALGEHGYEVDTGLFKIGNATTAWNDLGYAGSEGSHLASFEGQWNPSFAAGSEPVVHVGATISGITPPLVGPVRNITSLYHPASPLGADPTFEDVPQSGWVQADDNPMAQRIGTTLVVAGAVGVFPDWADGDPVWTRNVVTDAAGNWVTCFTYYPSLPSDDTLDVDAFLLIRESVIAFTIPGVAVSGDEGDIVIENDQLELTPRLPPGNWLPITLPSGWANAADIFSDPTIAVLGVRGSAASTQVDTRGSVVIAAADIVAGLTIGRIGMTGVIPAEFRPLFETPVSASMTVLVDFTPTLVQLPVKALLQPNGDLQFEVGTQLPDGTSISTLFDTGGDWDSAFSLFALTGSYSTL